MANKFVLKNGASLPQELDEEEFLIYDYTGWKRSPGESNEDYEDRIDDMNDMVDGYND